MKYKTKKKIQGSITVLMIIILVPMMTMSAIIVDSSRINMARSMVSSAGDLAANSALANYDTILKDVYGLFAMSQSSEDIQKNVKNYFETTLTGYGIVSKEEAGSYVESLMGDFSFVLGGVDSEKTMSNFLKMEVLDDFTAVKAAGSSLNETGVMRKQLIEYMKYRAPINLGMSFLDTLQAFKSVEKQTTVVDSQVKAQEKTQDVTSACKDAINEIRGFDLLIDEINGVKTTAKTFKNHTGSVVKLESYYSQLNKYKSEALNNYKHINTLNMVFLVKPVSTDGMYLNGKSDFIYTHDIDGVSRWDVKTDSGIDASVTLSDTKEGALTALQNQINVLTNENSTLLKTAKAYTSDKFLPNSYVTSDSVFNDEANAITAYVDYQKFIKNQHSSLNYNDIKPVLEDIVKLKKHYDDYYTKAGVAIDAAYEVAEEAYRPVKEVIDNAAASEGNVTTKRREINNRMSGFTMNIDFISETNRETLQQYVDETIYAPGRKTIEGFSFPNYSGYTSNKYDYSGGSDKTKYRDLFDDLCDEFKVKSGDLGDVAKAADEYYGSGRAISFKDFMKEKVDNNVTRNNLFNVLNLLYHNDLAVKSIYNNISAHNGYLNGFAEKAKAYNEAKAEYDRLVEERRTNTEGYSNCLGNFNPFEDHYRGDFSAYTTYKQNAERAVVLEANIIKSDVLALRLNVRRIIRKLEMVIDKLDKAKTEITKYQRLVDTWESSNNTYKNGNGNDSFAKQNATDIEKARSQYDLDALANLVEFIGKVKDNYNSFLGYIDDMDHLRYGAIKIYAVDGRASSVVQAINDTNRDALPEIVTKADAESAFDNIYSKADLSQIPGRDVEGFQEKFLKPRTIANQFLKYLNSAFPQGDGDVITSNTDLAEDSNQTESKVTISDPDEKAKNAAEKKSYETQKETLKGKGGEVPNEAPGGFGYTYNGKTVDQGGDTGGKAKNSKFAITEDEETGKVNASESMSAQKSGVSSVLSGIGNTAVTAVENLYILDYIFQNFSYNTLLQEMIVEDKDLDQPGKGAASYADVKANLGSYAADYKDKAKTMSNYKINGDNNHIFGAEVEYILYGNSSAATNVTYAKTSIYALRFAFDCIYSFTDSQIRNMTMAAGLAVQAATLGIVPYQVVQIVLQLALAAAEAAIDLDMISSGMKVAIVKTKDTWFLSLNTAAETVAGIVSETACTIADAAIKKATDGLQAVVDAGADELSGAVEDLKNNISNVANDTVEKIIDTGFSVVQSKIENALNEIQFIEYADKSVAAAKSEISGAFNNVRSTYKSELSELFGDNLFAGVVLPKLEEYADGMINRAEQKVLAAIGDAPSDVIGDKVASAVSEVKTSMTTAINSYVDQVVNSVSGSVDGLIADTKNQLDSYISQAGEELSAEATEALKNQIQSTTNDFFNNYVNTTGTTSIGSNGSAANTSSSIASVIRFGYKDYLMLFTYIAICAGGSEDNKVIERIADVIENNFNKSTDKAEFKHDKKGSFSMSKAFTYVNVRATAELDMLFVNLGFFSDFVSDDDGSTEVEGDLSPSAKIKYNGLYGY